MSLICVTAVWLPLLAGCGSTDGGGAEVVATTTQVADLTRNVAQDEIEVHGILAANSDPHDYEPSPSDATAIAEAKLVITSGAEVDEWVGELIESSGTDAEVISLHSSARITRTLNDGEIDPHWWHDPRNALAAVAVIRAELSEADPAGAAAYTANAAEYIGAIRKTDRAVAQCMASLPEEARKLVTSHDSLGYFADRYGIEVVGAAVPALSTQSQASTGETADLIALMKEEEVPAVFPEAGLKGDLEEAIAAEADVEVGGALYADALGSEEPANTYLGAHEANARALSAGFSNGASCPLPGTAR